MAKDGLIGKHYACHTVVFRWWDWPVHLYYQLNWQQLSWTYTTLLSSLNVFAPVAWSPSTPILSQRLQLLRGNAQISSLWERWDKRSWECEPDQRMICAHEYWGGYTVFMIAYGSSCRCKRCYYVCTCFSLQKKRAAASDGKIPVSQCANFNPSEGVSCWYIYHLLQTNPLCVKTCGYKRFLFVPPVRQDIVHIRILLLYYSYSILTSQACRTSIWFPKTFCNREP